MKLLIKIILFPFTIIYFLIIYIRNRLFEWEILKSESFDIPLISVGNLTAGGTGKTPMVEYIIRLLENEYNIVYLSRGYKRKTKGFIKATKNHGINDIGDEALQIAEKFGKLDVIVSEKRVEGISRIISDKTIKTPDVIILDDAYQHRYLNPGLSILLFDFFRPSYNDFILPSGRLRENFSERKRADIFVVTKTPKSISREEKDKISNKLYYSEKQSTFFSGLNYSDLKAVFPENQPVREISLADNNNLIVLLTGISNPKPILEYLDLFTEKLIHMKFPDHHLFTVKNLKKLNEIFHNIEQKNKIIITTEKDAKRINSSGNSGLIDKLPIYLLPVETILLENKKEFDYQIINYVRTAIRSS